MQVHRGSVAVAELPLVGDSTCRRRVPVRCMPGGHHALWEVCLAALAAAASGGMGCSGRGAGRCCSGRGTASGR